MSPTSRRAVLVTGASTGIGAATATHLDAAGFTVFAGVRRDEDGAALRRRASPRLRPLRLDVTSATEIAAAVDVVTAAVGDAGLAGLVNNAGIAVAAPLELVPLDDLRRQLEVNVVGLVAVTQAFLPLIRAARGRIVNIGSSSGILAAPLLGPYCASKFAVEALSDSLRRELRPWRIEVVLIEPGDIATPIWERSQAAGRALEARLPPTARELYGEAIDRAHVFAEETARHASPADEVAATVAHALTASRPPTRALVGHGSRPQALLARLLPDRALDVLLERVLGLPGRGSK
jgi:NAD(P)-dependent dehydrogenase (short-subunit alcohol dehydrogenase family)